jgi:hypothetical protein
MEVKYCTSFHVCAYILSGLLVCSFHFRFPFFCPVSPYFISDSCGFGWVSPKSLVFRSVYQIFGNGEALFEQIFLLSIPTGLPMTKSARVMHTSFEDYMVVCGYVCYWLRGYHS